MLVMVSYDSILFIFQDNLILYINNMNDFYTSSYGQC